MSDLSPEERDLLARIERKPELQPFFFRKIKNLKWLLPLLDAGYFDPRNNPRPIRVEGKGYINVPFWPVTEYLVAISPHFGNPDNSAYAERVLNVIREVTAHAKNEGFGNYKTWWQFSKILQHIPVTLLELGDVELIDYWLSDKYERGLITEALGEYCAENLLGASDEHSHRLAMELLRRFYKIEYIEKRLNSSVQEEAALRFDTWYAKKLTGRLAPAAGATLGQAAVDEFRQGLESIVGRLKRDEWSYIWRSAIEEHEQNHAAQDAEDVFVIGFRDALVAHVKTNGAKTVPYVASLLSGDFEITQRIALYAFDQRFSELEELLGEVVSEKYFQTNHRHEVWHILNRHYFAFPDNIKREAISIIERMIALDENGDVSEGATAYKKSVWLSAIRTYGKKESEIYKKCIDVVGAEPEHPDFASYLSVGWGERDSNISEADLRSLNVDELIGKLESDGGSGTLGRVLKGVIKSDPVRYFPHLHKFTKTDLAVAEAIIDAFAELWTGKASLPWDDIWGKLIAFSDDLLGQNGFWSNDNQGPRARVIRSISRLLESGTKSDEHAFDEAHIEGAEKVLRIILDKQGGEPFSYESDAVSVAINSPLGQGIEAFINLSLRKARLERARKGEHTASWNAVRPVYDKELRRADAGEFEFATLVVNYLPNFLFLSESWVIDNLPDIFDYGNYQKWLCALNGYAYVGKVYQSVYKFLRDERHFIKALDDPHVQSEVREKIVQNAVIAYLHGFEDIGDDEGLVHSLLERKNREEIGELIWFVWTQRDSEGKQFISRVMELWRAILERLDLSTSKGKELASNLCEWAVFIEFVNESNRPLIVATAPYAQYNYNSSEVLELVERVAEEQPDDAFKIWMSLLAGGCPDFPKEAIQSALKKFIAHGGEGVRKAKVIASEYLKCGNENPTLWVEEALGVDGQEKDEG